MLNRDGLDAFDSRAGDILGLIQELVAELHSASTPKRLIQIDSLLDRDLGLDSLARVELITRIERHFNVVMPEQVFAEAQTPRDLLTALLRAHPLGWTSPPPLRVTDVGAQGLQALPQTAQTLVEVLKWHVALQPDRPHIRILSEEHEDEVLTYRELWQEAQAVAAGLQTLGLHPGETVTIMLPTSRQYFLSFFGVILAGGIPVPIYPPLRLTQLEDHMRRHCAILANCRATILITIPRARSLAQLLKAHVESLRSVITVEELCSPVNGYQSPEVGPHDIAFLQYTSGSTGNPKGVILTHANLLANIRAMGEAVQATPADTFVSWLPLYHDMGLIGAWLAVLYHAAQLVIMSPLTFLSRPQRWLWAIHNYRGTLSAAPNFAYELCLRRIEERDLEGLDLSSWRLAVNGAEPVSPDTIERFCKRFGRYGFRREAMAPMYGLAEAVLALAMPPLGRGPVIDCIERKPFMERGEALPAREGNSNVIRFVACGQPLNRHEIRVVDEGGRELPERQEGRLQFRGPSATSGYFRNPQATRELFQGDWLDSGDLAYIADGEVYITGRTKDVIIRAGRNIYPHELEDAISNIEGIRKGRVAVFGSVDPDFGTERFVVLAETHHTEPIALERLRVRVNEVTADLIGMPPDDVVLAPSGTVLKTSSGKLRRSASRDLYERGAIGKNCKPVWWQVAHLALGSLWPMLRRLRRSAMTGLYAVYAWTVGVPITLFTWCLIALLPNLLWRWKVMRLAARCFVGAMGISCTVRGLEHLPPENHPCVFVANHASYLDACFLIACLPRMVSFVAKVELAHHFLTRLFLTRIGTEFVERFATQQGVADARRLTRLVRTGCSLLFFPEGTFTRRPGLLPFHMGAFLAAAEAGVPVVPIALQGTRSILRAGSWVPSRGAVTISIGTAIDPQKIRAETGADTWTSALRLRAAAREHILRHCREPDLAHEPSSIAQLQPDKNPSLSRPPG